jgi:hypothetical protein
VSSSQKTPASELDQTTAVASTTLRGELYDAHLDSMLRRFSGFMLRHPSMILTFGYLLCSLLGMLFANRLFSFFDINILPYLELTDFMLAALNHPWILLNVTGWLVFLVVLLGVDRYIRRHIRWYAAWSEKYYQPEQFKRYNVFFMIIPLLFLYNAAKVESADLAEKIKNNQQPKFNVSLIYPVQDGAKTLKFDQVQVIARTSSYLFIYVQQQVKVIPHANVAVIVPVAQAPLADSAINVPLTPNAAKDKVDSTTTEKAEAPSSEAESDADSAPTNIKG